MKFSRATLDVFAQLLGTARLNPMSPTLVEEAQTVADARRELEEAYRALDEPGTAPGTVPGGGGAR